MKTELHDRARDMVAASSVEGLTPAETAWLEDHLSACADCSQYAQAAAMARQALHSLSFRVNPALVVATQARVRLRARELREREHRLLPVWISCIVAMAVGVVSTPYLWEAFAWLGGMAQLPPPVWQTGFALFWFAPAVLAAILLLMFRGHGLETTAD